MQFETEAPTYECGGLDENGYTVVCPPDDDMEAPFPSEVLNAGHYLAMFLGIIFVSGLFVAAIMCCNRACEKRKFHRLHGKWIPNSKRNVVSDILPFIWRITLPSTVVM